ncbi:MAG: carbonate dehydratase [Hyphomicrobiales bacterium]|nr:carbonate dehydratase [Hyphomicrobiales bacterium]
MSSLTHILERNTQWSRERTEADPEFFSRLAGLQSPEMLWIGCSDSRVPANQVAGLQPGEVFVHRNVANLVYPTDINCMAVVQYAVESLKVKHIIVCGHYGCGGVRAALKGEGYGLIDHWLEPVKDLARMHKTQIEAHAESKDRINHLCELNVRQQVQNLTHSPIVQRAWEAGQDLNLHGWIYGLDNGHIHDLNCECGNPNAKTPAPQI